MSDLIRRDEVLQELTDFEVPECPDGSVYIAWGIGTAMRLTKNTPAVDAVEVVQKEAVDYGYLADWYIRSVTNDPPVWTEEHIEELFNDFYLVPKGERREENADDIGKSD